MEIMFSMNKRIKIYEISFNGIKYAHVGGYDKNHILNKHIMVCLSFSCVVGFVRIISAWKGKRAPVVNDERDRSI